MSGRYFFMVNEPPDEDRPIPEIAKTDAPATPLMSGTSSEVRLTGVSLFLSVTCQQTECIM